MDSKRIEDVLGNVGSVFSDHQRVPAMAAPVLSRPLLNIPSIPKDHTLADTMHDRLMQAIQRFQEELAPSQEVGAQLASFGQAVTVRIEDIGYHNPYLLIIYGTTASGERCTLLQHISQANILLIALPVPEGRTARRIGFEAPAEDQAAR